MRRDFAEALVWLLFLAVPGEGKDSAASVDSRRLAAQRIRGEDFAATEEIIRKVLAKEPDSATAENLLGVCQFEAGRDEAARHSFEKAIEMNPKSPAPRVNLGNMLLGLHEEARRSAF